MAFAVATGLYSAGDTVGEVVSVTGTCFWFKRKPHCGETACQESCSLPASLASRSALVDAQDSLGHGMAGRWSMGYLGMAI